MASFLFLNTVSVCNKYQYMSIGVDNESIKFYTGFPSNEHI